MLEGYRMHLEKPYVWGFVFEEASVFLPRHVTEIELLSLQKCNGNINILFLI